MLIGLISDTHIPQAAPCLPSQVKEIFRDVDLILHAGDVYTAAVLDELECLAPVLAAEGDDDYPEVMRDGRVKLSHTLTAENLTIHLTHIGAWGWPFDGKVQHSARHHQKELHDIVVFGHTHQAVIEKKGDILRVNPGSPTFPDYRRKLGTVALLSINSGKAEARIVHLK